MSNHRFGICLVIAALVLAAGCVGARSTTPVTRGTTASDTLAPSIFFEEGRLVFVGANVHLAKLSPEAELLPIEIAVANKRIDNLVVNPEHITLRSLDGRTWPVAAPEESAGSSLRTSFNRNLMPVPFVDTVKLRFQNYRYIPATFGAGLKGGNQKMTRSVELGKSTWTLAQVWFPNPGEDLKGQLYEVWLDSPDLPDPVFVTVKF